MKLVWVPRPGAAEGGDPNDGDWLDDGIVGDATARDPVDQLIYEGTLVVFDGDHREPVKPVTANLLGAGRTQESVDLANKLLDQLRNLKDRDGNLTQAGKILLELDKYGALITINPIKGADSRSDPERSQGTYSDLFGRPGPGGVASTITFDPYRPDALASLAHELVHSKTYIDGTRKAGRDNEFEPVRVENQILDLTGFAPRKTYGALTGPNADNGYPIPDWNKYIKPGGGG